MMLGRVCGKCGWGYPIHVRHVCNPKDLEKQKQNKWIKIMIELDGIIIGSNMDEKKKDRCLELTTIVGDKLMEESKLYESYPDIYNEIVHEESD